jgi:hypothetical protein
MEQQELSGILAPNSCDPVVRGFSCIVSSGRQIKEITYLADVLPHTAGCNRNYELWNRNDSILSRYWLPEDGVATSIYDNGTNGVIHLDSRSEHLTYGEVTPLGVRQLAYEMGIVHCDERDDQIKSTEGDPSSNKSEIVFYDLGSGVGRLVTQIYIDQPDSVVRAVGIELDADRHRIGLTALAGIIKDEHYAIEDFHLSYEFDRHTLETSTASSTKQFPVNLIHGDALKVDLDPATTHVFISSLCFPENVLLDLQKKLLRLPNIRVVAALNRLDLIHQLNGEAWEERNVSIQMSWGDSMAKIYRKVE